MRRAIELENQQKEEDGIDKLQVSPVILSRVAAGLMAVQFRGMPRLDAKHVMLRCAAKSC